MKKLLVAAIATLSLSVQLAHAAAPAAAPAAPASAGALAPTVDPAKVQAIQMTMTSGAMIGFMTQLFETCGQPAANKQAFATAAKSVENRAVKEFGEPFRPMYTETVEKGHAAAKSDFTKLSKADLKTNCAKLTKEYPTIIAEMRKAAASPVQTQPGAAK